VLKFEHVIVTIKAMKNGNRPIAQVDLLDLAVNEIKSEFGDRFPVGIAVY
jgi:hypothetical protein